MHEHTHIVFITSPPAFRSLKLTKFGPKVFICFSFQHSRGTAPRLDVPVAHFDLGGKNVLQQSDKLQPVYWMCWEFLCIIQTNYRFSKSDPLPHLTPRPTNSQKNTRRLQQCIMTLGADVREMLVMFCEKSQMWPAYVYSLFLQRHFFQCFFELSLLKGAILGYSASNMKIYLNVIQGQMKSIFITLKN